MDKLKFVDLGAQYQAYKQEIDQNIARVLEHGRFIMGPEVGQLEDALTRFTGTPHCISCANGTDALQLALMALDIGPGDEVITPSFTFIATVETIAVVGATPVFVDIDEETYTVDPASVAAAVTDQTRAIIPVSLFGQPADMNAINKIAADHGIVVIEDAAQSLGADYMGKRSCNLSELACTSFFPAKPLGCYGDGGAIFCTNGALADKLRALRVHGQQQRYNHKYIGINSRLDTLQAGILLAKLAHFDDELRSRRDVANYYHEALAGTAAVLPKTADGRTSAWAQYCIRVPHRDGFREALAGEGIPTAVYYPIPLHRQPAIAALDTTEVALPVSERVAEDIVALPFGPFITAEDRARVAKAARSALD